MSNDIYLKNAVPSVKKKPGSDKHDWGCLLKVIVTIASIYGILFFFDWLASKDKVGEHVYIEESSKGVILHTKRNCAEKVEFYKTSKLFEIFDSVDLFCTKCVSDKQYDKLVATKSAQERIEARREERREKKRQKLWEEYHKEFGDDE